MSEQAVDLRSALDALRRHRVILVAAGVVGVAAAVSLVVVHPPQYSSTSIVLLPPPVSGTSGQGQSDPNTQVHIVRSTPVLKAAGKAAGFTDSVRRLENRIHVTADTNQILEVQATGPTAAKAQALSGAVADAYLAFTETASRTLTTTQLAQLSTQASGLRQRIDDLQSVITTTRERLSQESPVSADGKSDAHLVGLLNAAQGELSVQLQTVNQEVSSGSSASGTVTSGISVIQRGAPATSPSQIGRLIVNGVGGGLLAVALAALLVIMVTRRDRRLRTLDGIADAVGTPVIAAMSAHPQRSAAGWLSLLSGYEPTAVESWALRQALRRLRTPGDTRASDYPIESPGSLTIVALSRDDKGLALAGQLASLTASLGMSTRIVPGSRHESASALWAALAANTSETALRSGLTVGPWPRSQESMFTVSVVVLDRAKPMPGRLPHTSATVLAVSAGAATAEELARVAVALDDEHHRIDGLLVADPDSYDRTTGRFVNDVRTQHVVMPTRLTGLTIADGQAIGLNRARRGRRK